MITILGPTATGKTQLAVGLAKEMNGAIISADSRQVFRKMDIGTGKDLREYGLGTDQVPFHLIDIKNPGEEYSAFEFQRDAQMAYERIRNEGKFPILCGGTGFYIESFLRPKQMHSVSEDKNLRAILRTKSNVELCALLSSYRPLHNQTDSEDRERLIRAIEIATHSKRSDVSEETPYISTMIFGVQCPRDVLMKRIEQRLMTRLEEGMIAEVEGLLAEIPAEKLLGYGLEYRYITLFLTKQISYTEMVERLNIAIRQFAKRQMTWFRKMEKDRFLIHWIPFDLSLEHKIERILQQIHRENK